MSHAPHFVGLYSLAREIAGILELQFGCHDGVQRQVGANTGRQKERRELHLLPLDEVGHLHGMWNGRPTQCGQHFIDLLWTDAGRFGQRQGVVFGSEPTGDEALLVVGVEP